MTAAAPAVLSSARAGWLDRLLANPRFRRLATAFPLTRPIARRHSRALFDLCAGFVYSQILLACVRLRLFEILAEGAQGTAALAPRLGLTVSATERLLRGAAALGLVKSARGGRYKLTALGAALIGNDGVTAMIAHHAMLYADLGDPVALLRGGTAEGALASFWPYATGAAPAALRDDQVASYSKLMAASLPMVAEEILAAYDFTRHRCLLDLGGGEGRFLAAVAAHAPQLKLMLFDLPAVAARAASVVPKASVTGGDMRRDSPPQDADIVTLIRVLHDHDEEEALAILRTARAALPQGGTLLIAEPMAGVRGAERMGDAYFGFYLLAMGSGAPRTADETAALARQAGFSRVRTLRTRTPIITSIIVAT
ncbi:MAG: methyltransferase domain-containing protein [Proteobacteria bacterium]|nr:methyltransferase domain-containing protein [Pseudomonadota bacterium]